MVPTCEVLLETDDPAAFDTIDNILTAAAERIERSRKGRVWDLWIVGRPIHVSASGSPIAVTLSAGCNSPEDLIVLQRLSVEIVAVLGGIPSDPSK